MTAPNLTLVQGDGDDHGDLGGLIESWERHLKNADKSPNTIKLYLGTARLLREFLGAPKVRVDATSITKEAIENFLTDVREKTSRSTAATRYAHLVQLFRWLVKEKEIETSPMVDIIRPKPEERPVPVIPLEDVEALLNICKGPDFVDRRDRAIIRLLLDGGVRRSELANVELKDLDLDLKRFYVYGKGRRERWVPIGRNALLDLDRYMRARRRHKKVTRTDGTPEPKLWLAPKGALTGSGMAQMLEARCKQAGLGHIHPHQFRHTFCHQWLLGEGNDVELAAVAGWASTQMAARYGASAAAERAHKAHARLSPGDLI